MCIRFVVNNDDLITGFNFDIDLAVWTHRVILEKDRFSIGILRPDGTYHSYHGVNWNGNAATLLYVHPSGRAGRATRVSFVYSRNARTVTWVENNRFDQRKEYRFSSCETAPDEEAVWDASERRPL